MTSMLVTSPPSDVSDMFEFYDTTLINLLDKHAPYHTVKVKAKSATPWFDTECHATKVQTRELEKMYRRKLSLESEIAWRTQFKAQRKLYQRKFVEYWSVAIDSCHRDGKALWSK